MARIQSAGYSVAAPVSWCATVAASGPTAAIRDRQCMGISPAAIRFLMSGRTQGLTPRSNTAPKCTIRTRTPLRHSSRAASTAELPPPTTITSWPKNGYGSR